MLTLMKTRTLALLPVKKNSLSPMELFQGLSLDKLQEIEKQLVERKYTKRETIFQEEDQADHVWFVQQGHVKEVHHSLNGKTQTISMVGADGIFGVSAFDGGSYGFHSIAVTDATIVSIPIPVFRIFMVQHPETARLVASKISKLLKQSRDRLSLSHERVEKRLLHVLLEMAEEFGNTIPMTHREIASMAGTSAETCSRTFSRLEAAGLITALHSKFKINSVDELRTRINQFQN